MRRNIFFSLAGAAALLTMTGCGSAPVRIDTASSQGITTVHQIDFKDWQIAADKGTSSMLESGVMKRADGRKTILMISDVKNSTRENVNTRILTDKIRQAVLRSGQAVVTTAVGAKGAEETAVRQVRELENDDLFNQSTVQKRGTVIAPDMSLSGEIVQQQRRSGRTEESYFFIHMVLTDLATGLAVWEDNVELAKQGTKSIFD